MSSASTPESIPAPPPEGLHDPMVPSAVDDMFDLAAPPLQMPVVARLVPMQANLSTIDVHQDDGTLVLGRAKELPPHCRIECSGKLSSKHCSIVVDPVTLRVTLVDTSTNGTFVNGDRLTRGSEVVLQSGDKLSLTKPPATDDSTANAEAVEYMFQRVKAETTVSSLTEELTCGICRSIFLRPVTLVPCMHVFCASCISQWLAQGQSTCAECRIGIAEIRPTHKIQSCVEQLLASNPSQRRTPEEVQRLEALDDIPPGGKVLRKRQREPSFEDDDQHYSGSDDQESEAVSLVAVGMGGVLLNPGTAYRAPYGATTPRGRCRQCDTPSAVDGFQCVDGGAHIICQCCRQLFPERPQCGRPQRCHMCSTPFCNRYFSGEGGCSAQTSGSEVFRRLEDHRFTAISSRTFGGNTTEQSILTTYLASHGILPSAAWATCIEKLKDGTWKPDLTCVNGEVAADACVCERCAERVFSALLFHYRRAIPSGDLPDSVTNRSNCWYGINCRTQFHKAQHAQSYNHICYQEKRKE